VDVIFQVDQPRATITTSIDVKLNEGEKVRREGRTYIIDKKYYDMDQHKEVFVLSLLQ
jgi:hypothetical protein